MLFVVRIVFQIFFGKIGSWSLRSSHAPHMIYSFDVILVVTTLGIREVIRRYVTTIYGS
jgi:hypothetical protein